MNSERELTPRQLVDCYYAESYEKIHGSGAVNRGERPMHANLERGRSDDEYAFTLELGAGELQHFHAVQHSFDRYLATDIRPVTSSPRVNKILSEGSKRGLEFKQLDATSLDLPDDSVDRIVATCLIAHIEDVYGALREWQRVLKPNGVMDFIVYCEPGILVRMFRKFFSYPHAKKHGVNEEMYRLVNAVDHVNSFPRVMTLTKAAIEKKRALKVRYYPFPWLRSWNLNAYAVVSIGQEVG